MYIGMMVLKNYAIYVISSLSNKYMYFKNQKSNWLTSSGGLGLIFSGSGRAQDSYFGLMLYGAWLIY
jgi:hypothetical protein